jgi:ATP-binding protein involved in chromosome partitioning
MLMTFLALMVSSFQPKTCTASSNYTTQGARRKCRELDIRLLGDVPLHSRICTDADAGKPTMVADPNGAQAITFGKIADEIFSLLNIK